MMIKSFNITLMINVFLMYRFISFYSNILVKYAVHNHRHLGAWKNLTYLIHFQGQLYIFTQTAVLRYKAYFPTAASFDPNQSN